MTTLKRASAPAPRGFITMARVGWRMMFHDKLKMAGSGCRLDLSPRWLARHVRGQHAEAEREVRCARRVGSHDWLDRGQQPRGVVPGKRDGGRPATAARDRQLTRQRARRSGRGDHRRHHVPSRVLERGRELRVRRDLVGHPDQERRPRLQHGQHPLLRDRVRAVAEEPQRARPRPGYGRVEHRARRADHDGRVGRAQPRRQPDHPVAALPIGGPRARRSVPPQALEHDLEQLRRVGDRGAVQVVRQRHHRVARARPRDIGVRGWIEVRGPAGVGVGLDPLRAPAQVKPMRRVDFLELGRGREVRDLEDHREPRGCGVGLGTQVPADGGR